MERVFRKVKTLNFPGERTKRRKMSQAHMHKPDTQVFVVFADRVYSVLLGIT